MSNQPPSEPATEQERPSSNSKAAISEYIQRIFRAKGVYGDTSISSPPLATYTTTDKPPSRSILEPHTSREEHQNSNDEPAAGAPLPIRSGDHIQPKYLDLKAKKRKRPDELPSDTLFVDVTVGNPPRSPKKLKSPNVGASSIDPFDERVKSPQSSFAPARKPPKSKVKAQYESQEKVDYTKRAPEWYNDVPNIKKFARKDLDSIKDAKDMITRCVANINDPRAEKYFTDLRTRLLEMEFYKFLTPNDQNFALFYIKKSKILESEGLPRIFAGPEKDAFPWDIRADAEALWSRWMVGDFDPNLLRGTETTRGVLSSGKKRTSHKLQPDYRYRKSPNVFGDNGLINGQWWPSRLCALRDGAHGEQEAGIYGQTGFGAFAVVVSRTEYDDIDNGDVIEYCGTSGENGLASRGTQFLLETLRKGEPLRVLRAHNKSSKYAPVEGVRYDGLYKITDSEIRDAKDVKIRFTLKRIEGQDPIRYKGFEARPSPQELRERMQIRDFLA